MALKAMQVLLIIIIVMANEIVLTKQSDIEEIKSYFTAILQLSRNNEQFPVNLDDVWQLVYSRRDNAVQELKRNFMQDIDYQVFLQIQEKSAVGKGRPKEEYYLSTSCLEYFIARKVRNVFEVYRNVFHNTALAAELAGARTAEDTFAYMSNPARMSGQPVAQDRITDMKVSMLFIKNAKSLLRLSDASVAKMINDVAESFSLPTSIDYTPSKGVLLSLTALLKRNNVGMSTLACNKLLQENGIIEVKTRKSSKGTEKHFNALTGKGLYYGENEVCPKNPKETQPMYYEDKFPELMVLINKEQASAPQES